MEIPPANDSEQVAGAVSAKPTRFTMEAHLRNLLQGASLSERLARDEAPIGGREPSGPPARGVLLDAVRFLRSLESELAVPMATALPSDWPPGRIARLPGGFHLLGVLALERRAPAGVLAECLEFYLEPGEAPEPLFAVILAVAATLDAEDRLAGFAAAVIPELLEESRRISGEDSSGLQRQVAAVQLLATLIALMRAASQSPADRNEIAAPALALERQREVLNQELRRIASHRSRERFALRGVRAICGLRAEADASAALTGTVYPDQLVTVQDVCREWCLVAARSYRTGALHPGWVNRRALGPLDIPASV